MLKVAVTGNMGSGKTSVCKVFEVLGIPVFYADREAKMLYNDDDIKNQVRGELGDEILDENNIIDLKAIASLVFAQPQKLEKLNKIIHPAVYQRFNHWLHEHRHHPYVIQEAAIVFETGSHERFDKIILVHAPEEVLISRVQKRDGSTREQVKQRLSRQMPQEEKIKMAHYLLCNDNTSLIIPEILRIHAQLLQQCQ